MRIRTHILTLHVAQPKDRYPTIVLKNSLASATRL
jgi:hypothetical protein